MILAPCGEPHRDRCRGEPMLAAGSIRHGAGVTRYQHSVAGIEQELTVFVAPADPVKLAVLTLKNSRPSAGASVYSGTSSGVSGRHVPASAVSSSPRWTT